MILCVELDVLLYHREMVGKDNMVDNDRSGKDIHTMHLLLMKLVTLLKPLMIDFHFVLHLHLKWYLLD